jgi:serine/threonine-protein phosphatase 2B regulatory subunit
VDGDGYIDKDELYGMLRATIGEKYLINITEDQMRAMVEQTFKETDLNSDGRISFEEYREMVRKHPSIIASLTIDHTELALTS